MAVRIEEANPVFERFDRTGPVGDSIGGILGIVGVKPQIDVNPAAGVGQSELGFPEFQIHRARQADPPALVAPVDRFEPQVGVKPLGPVEIRDLQHHLEDSRDPLAAVVGLADLDAVAVGVVDVQRARGAELVFVEVELRREALEPVVVLVGGRRERIVGVEATARNAGRSAEHEVGVAGGEDDLGIGFALDRQVEVVGVERAGAIEVSDFEREPVEGIEHGGERACIPISREPTPANASPGYFSLDALPPSMSTELPQLGGDGWESLYLDGEWRDREETIDVTDPYTRESIASVSAGDEGTVDEAYEAAAEAQREWADTPPQRRAEVVSEAIELIDEHRDELAELLTREAGSTGVKIDVEFRTAEAMMEVAAGFPFDSGGRHDRSIVPGKEHVVKREPVGVVGVISPWNFPFHLSMRAVAPALALGNAVVLKPASDTPITGGLAIARLFEQAGLPEGLLNVVPGSGSTVGNAVAGHEIPRVIAFTGSTEVGRGVASQAAEALSMPALELGGNNAHIVLEDADLDRAVESGVFGSFLHQGQMCIAINRHLVHESLYDEYVSALADRAASLPTGDPKEDDTVVGPIINEDQRDQMLDYVEETVEAGAILETGGNADELVVEPTVLSAVENDMAAACNEHFGPIAPVIPVADDEEAIELANATEYGLSGSVHSSDRERARRVADRVETGMIHVNDQPANDEPHIPFGGVGASGIGRYNDDAIKDELTTTKWVSVQREPREYPF